MSVARDAVGDELVYEVDSGVARLTLNRPAQRNAMTWEMVGAMRECLVEAGSDPGVGAVVLQGAGERAFCSGSSLSSSSPFMAAGTGRGGGLRERPFGWNGGSACTSLRYE
jgi:enoyl-CoA hydratase/carnithine racemase